MVRTALYLNEPSGDCGEKSCKPANRFSCCGLTVSLQEYAARVNGYELQLTKKELELLFTLACGHEKVYSRDELLDALWGIEYFGDARAVDQHIKRLRAKLKAVPHSGWEICTVRGIGYRLTLLD